jgi:hypothetical protein
MANAVEASGESLGSSSTNQISTFETFDRYPWLKDRAFIVLADFNYSVDPLADN